MNDQSNGLFYAMKKYILYFRSRKKNQGHVVIVFGNECVEGEKIEQNSRTLNFLITDQRKIYIPPSAVWGKN